MLSLLLIPLAEVVLNGLQVDQLSTLVAEINGFTIFAHFGNRNFLYSCYRTVNKLKKKAAYNFH